MYVEHPEVLKIMFAVNNETRACIQNNFISMWNGLINAGLITY